MDTPGIICPSCGATIDPGQSGGLCVACLLGEAVGEPETRGILGRIGGYELIEEIARGGMGVVYRARQAHPAREVALKAMQGASLRFAESRERFRIEAQAMARLEHPHILPIYEQGEVDEAPFLTMKLASGGSLAERIGRYAGKWREIAELVRTVAEAMQFAHEHGVLHRDLKPGNILFDENGTPFVCDFGLAKLAGEESDLTRTVAMLGTPNYMAPESTARAGKITTASDVWSLGVILYELLAGEAPFRGENLATVLRQIAEEEPPPPSRSTGVAPANAGIPRDLAVIALRALQKDPARRFGSARELADDLGRWLAGEPIHARPVPPAERVLLWAKRKPALAATSLALALVLMISAVLLLRANRDLRSAFATAQEHKGRAEASLRESLIGQARLMRQSTQLGQRFKSLELIRQAVAAGGPGIELRHEAAAALAKPDLELVGEIARFQRGNRDGRGIAVTPDLRLVLNPGPNHGEVALRDLGSGRVVWGRTMRREHMPDDFRLSASGRYAALLFPDHSVEVWDTEGNHLLHTSQFKLYRPFHLHANLPLCAGVDSAGNVWVHDLATGEHTEVIAGQMTDATGVLLTEGGDHLAIASGSAVELWQIAERRMRWRFPMQQTGELLDSAAKSFLAYDRETRHALVIQDGTYAAPFVRPNTSVVAGTLVPHTRVAVTVDQSGEVSAWDARDGRLIWNLDTRVGALLSAEDGRTLLMEGSPGRLMRWQHAPDRVFREFYFSGDNRGAATFREIEITPDGHLLATRSSSGAMLWDARERCFLRLSVPHKQSPSGAGTAFSPDGSTWYVSRVGFGTRRHSLEWAEDGTLRIGAPEFVPGTEGKCLDFISPDGQTWALRMGTQYQLWRPDGTAPDFKTGLFPIDCLSPTLRFAGSYLRPDRKWVILDARTGESRGEYAGSKFSRVSFSPGEQWLLLREPSKYQFIDTSTWQQRVAVPRRVYERQPAFAAVTQDGTLAAIPQDDDVIDLISLPTGHLLVQLTPPHEIGMAGLRFSHDGARLYVLGLRHRLFEWNLEALHEELTKLGLAW